MRKLYKPCSKDAACNLLYLVYGFMRRRALNVFPYTSQSEIKRPLMGIFLCGYYKPCLKDAAYEISLYLDYWFMTRRVFNVFPFICLCKIKRQFWADFIFMRYLYTPCPEDAVYQISEYLECQFMRCFKIQKFYPFFPFIGAQ